MTRSPAMISFELYTAEKIGITRSELLDSGRMARDREGYFLDDKLTIAFDMYAHAFNDGMKRQKAASGVSDRA